MSDAFTSVSKFRVQLVNSDGSTDRVVAQIGLDGFKILDAASNRTMRSLELGHISRWQSRGSSLVLYVKTPVDVEERQLTLQGDDSTIRNALDTLTCSCMQLAELLQSKQTEVAQETASSLHALVAGGGKKKSKLPTADEVEYWRTPDKAGWLQCQGEHLKSWRKRWFVLKQGFLFRFMNSAVSEATKPRGVVDLSKIQDVKPASNVTGRPNSLQLKTSSGGSVCYITDTETELVEWMSAIEGAVQRICRHAAGVDDEPPAKAASRAAGGSSAKASGAPNASEWMKQLERTMESFEQKSGGGGGGGRDRQSDRDRDWDYGNGGGRNADGPAMVQVIGYETFGGGNGGSGGGGGSGRQHGSSSAYGGSSSYGAGNGSSISYGQIAGAAVVSNDTMLNYGGGGGGGVAPSLSSDPYLSRGAPSPSGNMYGGGGSGSGGGGGGGGYSAPYQQQQQQLPQQYGGVGGNGGLSSPHQQPQQQQGGGAGYYSAPGQGYGQQLQGMGGAQGGPAMSLIDQVPQQQPTYPYYQQTASAPQPQPQAQAPVSSWQVHYTGEGRPYYHNPVTGSTQWEAPLGFA